MQVQAEVQGAAQAAVQAATFREAMAALAEPREASSRGSAAASRHVMAGVGGWIVCGNSIGPRLVAEDALPRDDESFTAAGFTANVVTLERGKRIGRVAV